MKTPRTPKRLMSLALLSLILSTVLIYSCKKEGVLDTQNSNEDSYFQLSHKVSSSVAGKVLYEDGTPAKNINVELGSFTSATDENGNFMLENISAPKNHAHLSVKVDGYFTGHRTIKLVENGRSYTDIRLLKKEKTMSFSAQNGATVNVTGGGKIIFAANSIMDKATETAYAGNVNVYAKRINPINENLDEIMPGCLRGITSGNIETNLTTFGMFAVELYDDNNQALQIQTGKSAELHFPIPSEILVDAESTAPSWSLDENLGLWKEEGVLNKVGNEYIGLVSHFSFWNCDLAGSNTVTMELRDSISNAALAGYKVKLTRQLNNLARFGYTNSQGQVSGGIIPNETYLLEVILICGSNNWQVVKTMTFTTGNGSINLGTIPVASVGNTNATITGTVVDVNNMPLPNAQVAFRLASSHPNSLPDIIKADASGHFSYGMPVCTNSVPVIVAAYDSLRLTNSGPLSFNIQPGSQNIGNLNTSAIESEHITVTSINGGIASSYQIVEPMAGINCYVNGTASTPYFNCNIFSRVLNQNWSANFYAQGPVGTTGSKKLTRFRDRFDAINSYSWTNSLTSSINVTRFGTSSGDFVTGDAVAKYTAPNNNESRIIHFHIRRDN